MLATDWMYQPPAYTGSYPLWVDESSVVRNLAAASASLLPAAHPLHLLVTLRLRIARGEQLGLVLGLASVSPAAFEILAVKSYGAVHCLNRILDDDDPRYVSTGDIILEANGRTHPAAMIHELLCSRCISLTLAKPRRADVASAVAAPLSEVGSCGEAPTVFTPRQLFSATPESPRSVSDEILEPASSDVLYSDSAAHCCFNRILDDNDSKYLATEDFVLEANGRRHPTAMIHELLCSRCISLTLAKPRRADVASASAAPLSELGSWDESLTVFTPRQLFSATPESPRSVSDEILEPASSGIFYCDSY